MIKSLAIKNFRCFRDVSLADLKRVNIVVGKNATGKTALLEAIFLAAGGSPGLVFKLRHFRGMGQAISGDVNTIGRIWEELSTGFKLNESICVQITGSENDSRSLCIES